MHISEVRKTNGKPPRWVIVTNDGEELSTGDIADSIGYSKATIAEKICKYHSDIEKLNQKFAEMRFRKENGINIYEKIRVNPEGCMTTVSIVCELSDICKSEAAKRLRKWCLGEKTTDDLLVPVGKGWEYRAAKKEKHCIRSDSKPGKRLKDINITIEKRQLEILALSVFEDAASNAMYDGSDSQKNVLKRQAIFFFENKDRLELWTDILGWNTRWLISKVKECKERSDKPYELLRKFFRALLVQDKKNLLSNL